MKLIIKAIIISLLFVACNTQNNSNIKTISIKNAKTVHPSSVFKSVDIIPLQLNEKSYFKGVTNMLCDESNFIICDNRNILYTFDSNGKFISSSEGKLGNGAGEYSVITAFTYNHFSKQIEIATPKDILFYDVKFNLIKRIKIKDILESNDNYSLIRNIDDLSQNVHLLQIDSNTEHSCTAYIYDSNNNTVLNKPDINSNAVLPITMQNSCVYNIQDGKAMFSYPFSPNLIYDIDLDDYSFTPRISMDFGNEGLSNSEIEKYQPNEEKMADLLLTTSKLIPVKCMSVKNKVLLVVKKGNQIKDWITYYVDLKDLKVLAIPHSDKDANRLFPIYNTVYDNCIYAVVTGEEAIEYTNSWVGNNNNKHNNVNSDDDMAILKFTLK